MNILINFQYLRYLKGKVLKQWHNSNFVLKESLKVWRGANATILPLKKLPNDSLLFGRAGVIDENNEYVNLSAIERRVEHSYPIDKVEYCDKRVVYCGYLVKHWGHFLVESVSRLWYFLENNQEVDSYIFVVDENKHYDLKGNYKEFFDLLGITNKIEIINKPTKYKEVIVPELGYKWRTHYSLQQKAVFDCVVKNVKVEENWTKSDKVYMSRSQLKNIKKIEYGNDMLDNYFEKNGYLVLYPEKISLSKLIYLLNNCNECASISGSLPHNMLFAPDNSKLVILERNVLNNEIQVDINCIKKLNVTYVDANIPIYSINLGYGPFIMGYNKYFEKYTIDNNYLAPDKKYLTEKYLKKGFIMYMKAYEREYHYQWFMEDWSIKYCDYLREAYLDGVKYFEKYLNGKKPFMWYHYFMPHYWKQAIKIIIGR